MLPLVRSREGFTQALLVRALRSRAGSCSRAQCTHQALQLCLHLLGGRLRGLQGAAAGAAVGVAVVFGREQFRHWRLSKALERYEAKHGTAPAVYYPDTDILVETKGPVRELEFPSLLPKSIKVTEGEIERRIQARVEELRQEARDAKDAPPSSAPAATSEQ